LFKNVLVAELLLSPSTTADVPLKRRNPNSKSPPVRCETIVVPITIILFDALDGVIVALRIVCQDPPLAEPLLVSSLLTT
jgi:hypothetical protein